MIGKTLGLRVGAALALAFCGGPALAQEAPALEGLDLAAHGERAYNAP